MIEMAVGGAFVNEWNRLSGLLINYCNNGRAWKTLEVSTWRVFVKEGNSSLLVSVQPKSKEKERSCKFYSFGFAMKEASKLLCVQFFPWSNDNGKKNTFILFRCTKSFAEQC